MSLPNLYQDFIHLSRYSRWIESENRRETWEETVKRYFDFFENKLKENNKFILSGNLRKELETAVLNLEIMPSMRS
jgi:ribonucleoside-diphosphate reductase alpha chain